MRGKGETRRGIGTVALDEDENEDVDVDVDGGSSETLEPGAGSRASR
jgi:hypothetical protein